MIVKIVSGSKARVKSKAKVLENFRGVVREGMSLLSSGSSSGVNVDRIIINAGRGN